MSKIHEYLTLCKKKYYKGDPIISDSQYDALIDIYGEKEVGSPNGEVPHFRRLYSLKKYYAEDDTEPAGGYIKVVTPKLDGAVITILYVNGYAVQVLTRGDGKKGKDISHLFDLNKSFWLSTYYAPFPKTLDSTVMTQIVGEIVAPKEIPNARNYAAGALGLKDFNEFAKRNLTFVAHGIWPYVGHTYTQDMTFLIGQGFTTVLNVDEDKFPTDGFVKRVDDNEKFERAGYTAHHPQGAYAVKHRSKGIKTKILDVEWQTGKTGKVTPVAILDPIKIDGAQVSRATLNNVGFIETLGVEIGDEVMVERAGGIIPRIIRKAD
jgi:DNA ligase (NAD+)